MAAPLHEMITRILVLVPVALGAVFVLCVLLVMLGTRGSRGRRY